MAILGVLLGIVITVMAGVGWWGFREYKAISSDLLSQRERLNLLERRKAIIAEAVASQPVRPGMITKIRTWNEDAPASEAVTR